ncbi:hypothetical protein VPLG_00035 [Vibrio phage eugene 12A10]|uniref:hypothetical protein n=1 Tax=Vibrio phage eugene 12A10 TaxID=573172 RepID=UPI0003514923|nr:hypothetical protein VPLG_00035 [Vibrio phage eugene 12A10]AGN51474.1 hypothetical protein VPLG_00035 [Vibrio phage eugene 12A10]
MWDKIKSIYTSWYRKHFWKQEDHWAYIFGLKRKWLESDEELRKRIEDSLYFRR